MKWLRNIRDFFRGYRQEHLDEAMRMLQDISAPSLDFHGDAPPTGEDKKPPTPDQKPIDTLSRP